MSHHKSQFPSYLLDNESNIYEDPIFVTTRHRLHIKSKQFPKIQNVIKSKFKKLDEKQKKQNKTEQCTNNYIVPINRQRSLDIVKRYFNPLPSRVYSTSFLTSLFNDPIGHNQSNFQIIPYTPPFFQIDTTKRVYIDTQVKTEIINLKKQIVGRRPKISLRPLIPKDGDPDEFNDEYNRLIELLQNDFYKDRAFKKKQRRKERENYTKLSKQCDDVSPSYIY